MPLNFDDEVVAALQVAKNATNVDEQLKVWQVLAALVHRTSLRERFPELRAVLPVPEQVRTVDTMAPADDLKQVLQVFNGYSGVIRADALFRALMRSPAAQQYLKQRGVQPDVIQKVLKQLETGGHPSGWKSEQRPEQAADGGSWRQSPKRQHVIQQLSRYGRIMTEMPLKKGYWIGREKVLEGLLINLVKRPGKGRSTIIIGPPGVGKTGVVYELARRLREGDWKVSDEIEVPQQIRDVDIFQLFPAYLRAGTALVGEYEKRLKELIELLEPHPKVILFVDEVHSLLQSGMHHSGAFSQANEALKGPIMEGQITLIGCTTTAEYRHYIECDPAMAQRLSTVVIDPMDTAAVISVLQRRREEMEGHFKVKLTDELLQQVVNLTEEYIPSDCQPRKSIRLLEDACARRLVHRSPAEAQGAPVVLGEDDLLECLETRGVRPRVRRQFTVHEVRAYLTGSLFGQDAVLGKVAELFVGGFADFQQQHGAARKRPRGVWLFGGPTGVGKTEAARLLAKLLGDKERESWIRVDCNTLLGSGVDSSPAVNRLLGVPPGFIGYARGEGGLLSRIRDNPECIVLFDEFEKADPGVGRLLLQIIDEGKVQDSEGNLLDFRRSFIIFTTNAGCTYESGPELGFLSGKDAVEEPHAEYAALRKELRAMGLGEEFLARMDQVFLFRALSKEAILEIIGKQLDGLRQDAKKQGLQLDWDGDLAQQLAGRWKPRHGARALTHMLRDRVINQLNIAHAEGQLEGIQRVYVSAQAPPNVPGERFHSIRKVDDGTLTIYLQDPKE